MTLHTFATALQVREFLAAKGFAKSGINCQGTWTDKAGNTTRVGMSLAKNYRTGQSSQGGGNWVYTVRA